MKDQKIKKNCQISVSRFFGRWRGSKVLQISNHDKEKPAKLEIDNETIQVEETFSKKRDQD